MEKLRYYYTDFELFKVQDVSITVSHLVVALFALVAAFLLSKIVRILLKRRVFRRVKLESGLEYALLRLVHYTILVIGVYIGLKTIKIPLEPLLGLFAILGVGIGFGLQKLAANFISGIILLIERPLRVGDRIEVEGLWGDVERINLRTTIVTTPDNISIIIPNASILDNNLTNYYHTNRKIRIRVPVGVAYGSDVHKVTSILQKAAEEEELVLDDPPPRVWFMEFGDSSLNFQLLCWIGDAALKFEVLNRLNRRIDDLFREEGVEIPFPQRDLHLRSVEGAIPFSRQEA
jgi:small-conductance mechanosensitive channel